MHSSSPVRMLQSWPHSQLPSAMGGDKMPPSAPLCPDPPPVIPGGRVAVGLPVGARGWYPPPVTGFTVATVSEGPCGVARGLWSGLGATPQHGGARGWSRPHHGCGYLGC